MANIALSSSKPDSQLPKLRTPASAAELRQLSDFVILLFDKQKEAVA